jgi:hypothetical protein
VNNQIKYKHERSFQEWEREYVAYLAFIRDKYKALITTPRARWQKKS